MLSCSAACRTVYLGHISLIYSRSDCTIETKFTIFYYRNHLGLPRMTAGNNKGTYWVNNRKTRLQCVYNSD